MTVIRYWLPLLAIAAAVSVGCESAEDKARAALSQRLRQETRLTQPEIVQLFGQIAPAIARKTVQVQQGALTRPLSEEERLKVLGMLSDPAGVYDAGLQSDGRTTLRALTSGATPVQSEVDAMQTLWIDADTFLPRKYEFAYSMPGLGDYSYDLTFSKSAP